MNNYSLILGILPLLVFVLVDTFSTLKMALISAVVLALVETVFTIYQFGTLDWITGISFLLVGLMSYFAWKKDDEKIFMWQPVIISWVFALYIFIVKLTGSDIFVDMFEKYGSVMPDQMQAAYQNPIMQQALRFLSWTAAIAFTIHGAVTLLAAYKLNKWWWLAARGVGFYVFMAGAVFSAQYLAISTFQ